MNFLLFSLFSKCSEVNGIFKRVYSDKIVVLDVSGSSSQYINGSRQLTKPEYAIYPWDKNYDWCSNCYRSNDEHPYITFSLINKKFKIKGYFLRAGCCYQNGCCCEEIGYCVMCCLYSWSLQISDDNKTWKEIHRIDKDIEMRRCKEQTYNFDQEYTAKYVRLIQNEPCPEDPPCIALNKIEFLGDVTNFDINEEFVSYHDDDDDVSIIGHISKNGNVRFS
ncbi:hypothetical protein TVAG_489160 [Trichomonas vaginalis G3]|uniref:F5/8 type C domain-containing protein n=1 Tax=Trichomonas vaginalis (strain ATCC PRA-98 / G3) TaxID=412133 RepID=A2EVC6_TRIV3|nr:galactose-binding domain-like family [Trichomonas vaginalis G3]EAY03372.1 hypothetical protein TVAG_489160 [Trichomonas vaginalis G3]KAI5538098.1 galactose-binding domain-like family [Trichomonas vaginalis G3]|eukprot:XP_001315595.1 hypothetical protein [Trichomonas vaginalis G3]